MSEPVKRYSVTTYSRVWESTILEVFEGEDKHQVLDTEWDVLEWNLVQKDLEDVEWELLDG